MTSSHEQSVNMRASLNTFCFSVTLHTSEKNIDNLLACLNEFL